MSLALMWTGLDQPEGTKKQILEKEELKKYLSESVRAVGEKGRGQEEFKKVKSAVELKAMRTSKKVSEEVVEDVSKQIRQEMKGYSLKTKLNEHFAADRIEEGLKPYNKTQRFIAEAFAIAAPAFCTGFAVSIFNDTAGKIAGGAVAAHGLMHLAIRKAVLSSNDKEAMDVKKYGELKRMDWALKMLKKEMVKNKMMDSILTKVETAKKKKENPVVLSAMAGAKSR